jgi:hypothetical protein
MEILGIIGLGLVALIAFIIFSLLVLNERYFTSVAIFVVGLATIYAFRQEEVTAFLQSIDYTRLLLVYVPSWIGIGAAIAFLNWIKQVADFGSMVRDAKANVKNFSADVEEKRAEFIHQFDRALAAEPRLSKLGVRLFKHNITSREDLLREITPLATKNAYRISWWVVLWPLVAFNLLTDELIERIGKIAAEIFDATFGRITRNIMSRSIGEN